MLAVVHTSLCQTADIGGWLLKYGSMTAVDKALDLDPCLNHTFVDQAEGLIVQKRENPGVRITKAAREAVEVVEQKTEGLKMPKRKFIALDVYERKHGPVNDVSRIKVQKVGGVEIKGVDVVEQNDIGVYEYIDEFVNTVERRTSLTDPNLTVTTDQTNTVYAAAAKHLSSTPAESNCVILNEGRGIQSQSSGPDGSTTGSTGDGARDPDAEPQDCQLQVIGRLTS